MARAPIYDDHVERCNGPAKVVFMVAKVGVDPPFYPKFDTYEAAEREAKQCASTFAGSMFEIRKAFIAA